MATVTGTGEEQTINILENIPNGPIHLTITGENLIRWEEDIPLEPLNRPFVVVDSIAMNGWELALPYNQSYVAGINVNNVGLQGCNGGTVSMTSDSQLLAILLDETSFDALEPNASQFIVDAFQIAIGDSIHDRTHIPFTLTTYFGDETYEQEYEIEVLSPSITAELVHINDSLGDNDQRLDPGEFASLTFRVTNTGHDRADSPLFSLSNNLGYARVITPETPINDLEVDESTEITFDIYVEYIAGEMPYIYFTVHSTINNLKIEQDIQCEMGFVTDSFEHGIFEPAYWTNDPQHPWTITTTHPYHGTHCAMSGDIDHNESSQLILTFTSTESENICFFKRVSSEANYDFLVFYIYNEEQDRWSGELWWSENSYPISPGRHTYKWEYAKDHSVDSGSDCACIDYITLPPYLDKAVEQNVLPLTLHPNPTTDQITVSLEQEGDFNILVFDIEGKLIFSERNTQVISMKGHPAGIYQIIVEQNGLRWSRKIIKI